MSIPVGCSINIMSSVAVASTGVVYGNSADLRMFRGFSLRIQATSATGTPDLQVEWEASNVRPSTEAAVDTNYVIPDEMNTSMDPTTSSRCNSPSFSTMTLGPWWSFLWPRLLRTRPTAWSR